mmetsp:Transcript_114592/g.203082  ORF Transcript_114592/g.203082 Transcript_114592/m.203082 type:complete len:96 (+) Transcript_114592:1187-1474(+)
MERWVTRNSPGFLVKALPCVTQNPCYKPQLMTEGMICNCLYTRQCLSCKKSTSPQKVARRLPVAASCEWVGKQYEDLLGQVTRHLEQEAWASEAS